MHGKTLVSASHITGVCPTPGPLFQGSFSSKWSLKTNHGNSETGTYLRLRSECWLAGNLHSNKHGGRGWHDVRRLSQAWELFGQPLFHLSFPPLLRSHSRTSGHQFSGSQNGNCIFSVILEPTRCEALSPRSQWSPLIEPPWDALTPSGGFCCWPRFKNQPAHVIFWFCTRSPRV